jgi:hypothetical protein
MVDNTIALRGESLQAPNLLGMANTAAQTRNTLAQTDIDQSQEQRAQYTGEVQKSRDALAYVNSPEQYLAWHEANHSNPVLGPMLSKMGVTAEQSRAKIMDELQKPGGLERLIQQSAAGADKISGIMQGRLNQMASDRATAAANARKAQERAQISGGATPAPAPANALAPVATATPVAPPRNTLAAPEGSPTAIENLYAPALANANVTAATPFSQPQGGGDAAVMNRINRLQELYMNGNQEAGRQLKILVDGLKRDKDLGIGVDGGMKPSEQFVPVGKNVFDRETRQFIQPPTPEEVESIKPQLQKGERWNPEEGRVEAVPGSKLYIEQSQKHAKSKQAYDTTNLKVNQMNEKIAEILDPKNADAFEGNFGGYTAYGTRLASGKNSNLRKKIESFKSNMKGVGLELIRSGGSIGQMTEQEWPIVEQMLGAIDPVLEEDDARLEFQKIQARINNILEKATGLYQDEWGNTQYYKPTKGKDNKPALTGKDAQAAEWANANPNDPRSAEIKRRLGL